MVDKSKYKQDLADSTKVSHDTRDFGAGGKRIFNSDAEIKFWKCDDSDHIIDIIPYLAGKNDPKKKEGHATYILDAWVHRGIGPNENTYICLAKMRNAPCPICERIREMQKEDDVDEDTVKKLRAKRRAIYNIICRDNDKEEAKGIQVWDIAHWYMERNISSLAKMPRDGGFIVFSDPDDGKSIAFEMVGQKGSAPTFIGHKFVDRDYKIADDDLDAAVCLDEALYIPTYEEVSNDFYGTKPEEEDDDDDDEGTPIPPKEEKKEEEKEAVDPAADRRSKRRQQRAQKTQEDNPCPHGYQFGIDTDKKPECTPCKVWEKCADKADENEAGKK